MPSQCIDFLLRKFCEQQRDDEIPEVILLEHKPVKHRSAAFILIYG